MRMWPGKRGKPPLAVGHFGLLGSGKLERLCWIRVRTQDPAASSPALTGAAELKLPQGPGSSRPVQAIPCHDQANTGGGEKDLGNSTKGRVPHVPPPCPHSPQLALGLVLSGSEPLVCADLLPAACFDGHSGAKRYQGRATSRRCNSLNVPRKAQRSEDQQQERRSNSHLGPPHTGSDASN